MPKLNYAYLKKEPATEKPQTADEIKQVEAEPQPQAETPNIAEIKQKGKGTIELPNTGGYFIVTYHDMNRNRYGVLFTPDGKPIAMR